MEQTWPIWAILKLGVWGKQYVTGGDRVWVRESRHPLTCILSRVCSGAIPISICTLLPNTQEAAKAAGFPLPRLKRHPGSDTPCGKLQGSTMPESQVSSNPILLDGPTEAASGKRNHRVARAGSSDVWTSQHLWSQLEQLMSLQASLLTEGHPEPRCGLEETPGR